MGEVCVVYRGSGTLLRGVWLLVHGEECAEMAHRVRVVNVDVRDLRIDDWYARAFH